MTANGALPPSRRHDAAAEMAALRLSALTARGARGVLGLLRERSVVEVWEADRAQLIEWSGGRPWVDRFLCLREESAALGPPSRSPAPTWSFVAHGAPGYPPCLLDLDAPPAGLYLRGDAAALVAFHELPRVAVVGTRRASSYGLAAAAEIAGVFARSGVCVLSGLALGVDGRAHRAALEGRGLTVAVLGCGIDVVYPRRHRDLYSRVERGGALISEYPPGTLPTPWAFPERNRLLAALSDAVVVVEAPLRSGALITAERAMELGREVFAVPGPILGGGSDGCNRLIYDGAGIVLDPDDLVEEFLRLTRMERREREPRRGAGWREVVAVATPDPARSAVLEALQGGAACVEEVVRATMLSPRDAAATLSLLELDSSVRRCSSGRYVLA